MPDYSQLPALLPDVPVHVLSETASTNADARALLLRGGAHGSLVVAARQTGGRGRMGRVFCSEEGGLYMSLLLRGAYPAGQLTTLCAVAVCRAVQRLTGLELDIKWVNDAHLNGKKVCGILCEGAWSGAQPLGMVAGIGINLSQPAFPPELTYIVRSLYPNGDAPCTHAQLCAAVYREIMNNLSAMPAHMPEYRARCITLHRPIVWQQDGIRYSGYALDVDDDGGLIVDTHAGRVVISAGAVSVRPAQC